MKQSENTTMHMERKTMCPLCDVPMRPVQGSVCPLCGWSKALGMFSAGKKEKDDER